MTASDQAETLDNNTPENQASQTPANGAQNAGKSGDVSTLTEQVAAAKKEAADNYDKYVRTVADLENFRRRATREKDELRQFAIGRVVEDLLPILDNLNLGLNAAKAPNAELKTLVGGIGMVQDQFRSVLSNHGLKEINPVGQAFDPNQHESIASQPDKDVPEGKVLQVVRVGFSLNGRVIRPASVILSSGRAKDGAAT
ncbi:MAG TPA: nucleotide exchange factor GrpE [Opitutaceae bacterium]|nr:nucleotide exchange factor GrpE [Opitutaceae bacterium]